MEWLSAENIVAVLTAVLGILASAAVLWYERRVPRRKRIGYRVQMDTPIGSNVRNGRPNTRLGLFNETPDMSDATLVLLRIENDGSQSIADNDYTGRELHGLTAEFTDRTIRAIAVTPLFSRPARLITVLLTVCVVTLASIIVVRDDAPPPIGCAKGTLTVTGSTAFAPVVKELAKKYENDCEGSTVTVDAHGSTAGIRALADAGAKAKNGSPALIALSDGPKSGGHPQLRDTRVAVSVFALVVNDRVPLRNLSIADIRKIYRGEVRNWKDLGGPNLPVLLVSRDANSGTREVFQRRVLARNEPVNSSRDCEHNDDPESTVVRCELDSTEQVLATVARLPGAIGYSELRAGTGLKGLHRLDIAGERPSVDDIGESAYPYREIEYACTYGQPPADSLASSFLGYMSRGSGQDVIRTHGHLPCATPKGLRICGED